METWIIIVIILQALAEIGAVSIQNQERQKISQFDLYRLSGTILLRLDHLNYYSSIFSYSPQILIEFLLHGRHCANSWNRTVTRQIQPHSHGTDICCGSTFRENLMAHLLLMSCYELGTLGIRKEVEIFRKILSLELLPTVIKISTPDLVPPDFCLWNASLHENI